LAVQLETLGAEVLLLPTIELAPPSSWSVLDASLAGLGSFDWLLFTSANAVHAFAERAYQQQVELAPQRIAVIGPATARAVESAGLTVGLIPGQYVAEALAEALVPYARGKSFLLVRAEEARDVLPDALTAAGAQVTVAPAYRNLIPADAVPALQTLFDGRNPAPAAVTFTSSSTARNLMALFDAAGIALPAGIALASIGPITSATLRALGHEPTLEAGEPTVPALAQAIATYFSQ